MDVETGDLSHLGIGFIVFPNQILDIKPTRQFRQHASSEIQRHSKRYRSGQRHGQLILFHFHYMNNNVVPLAVKEWVGRNLRRLLLYD